MSHSAGDAVTSRASSFRRPTIKPEHVPYRIADQRIRIGGVVYGIAAELHDPTGALWSLLEAMDGTRDVEQIAGVGLRRASGLFW